MKSFCTSNKKFLRFYDYLPSPHENEILDDDVAAALVGSTVQECAALLCFGFYLGVWKEMYGNKQTFFGQT